MPLAIFDLDDTLIRGSSDFAWEQFLVSKKILNEIDYRLAQKQFQIDYVAGNLDIYQRQAYFLETLRGFDLAVLYAMRDEFMQTIATNMLLPKALELVATHRARGDTILIITAANHFITEPIAALFEVDALIATEAKMDKNGFTGEVEGVPSFRDGKVIRLNHWLNDNPISMENSTFYSDSINDLPLLELVANPIVVDPEDKLREVAQQRQWQMLSLRD